MYPRAKIMKLRPTILNDNKLSFILIEDGRNTRADFNIELARIKTQLSAVDLACKDDHRGIGEYVVNEDKSTGFDEDRWKITFNDPSLVVRAMHSIPEDLIDFGNITQKMYTDAMLIYPFRLTAKTCWAFDMQYVVKASEYFHTRIQAEVAKAHAAIMVVQKVPKKTPIMEQLEKELLLINEMKEPADPFREKPRSHLAYACLVNAYKTIDQVTPKGFLANVMHKPSPVSVKYKEIIGSLCKDQSNDFDTQVNRLIKDYETEIAAKLKLLAAPTSSGSNVADEKSATAGSAGKRT